MITCNQIIFITIFLALTKYFFGGKIWIQVIEKNVAVQNPATLGYTE